MLDVLSSSYVCSIYMYVVTQYDDRTDEDEFKMAASLLLKSYDEFGVDERPSAIRLVIENFDESALDTLAQHLFRRLRIRIS